MRSNWCRRISLRGLLLGLSMLSLAGGPAVAAPDATPGARPGAGSSHIVVLKPGSGSPGALARDLGHQHRFDVGVVYSHALRGFSAVLPPAAVEALRRNPAVDFVEPDQPLQMASHTLSTGLRRIFAPGNASLAINGADDWRVDADVAVLDTGIYSAHQDLAVAGSVDCTGGTGCVAGGADGNGHGTHVAGIIGALDNGLGSVGVAPGVRLWAVKVLGNDGSGSISWALAGIDWVTARADAIRVANLSLICECTSLALDRALARSVRDGVTYIAAAGNYGRNAADFSPARHPDVIAVSALADFDGRAGALATPTCLAGQDDTLVGFSNYGAVVDLAAPGTCIYSTWRGGGYATATGTSMAAPHTAGAAALLVASGLTSPAQIRGALLASGNYAWTDSSGDGYHEPLLDVSDAAQFAPALVTGAVAPPLPSVTISSPASGTSVDWGTALQFSGQASDGAGHNLSSMLVWTSDLVGQIGTGPGFFATLPAGQHQITARTTSPAASRTVSVTVNASSGGCGGCHH